MTVSSERLLALLGNPDSYPHRPARVEIVQTHISYVAVAPPLVFKVKKPLALGFLDFSTLEKRRHYCHEELRLNRRLCAHVYEAVVPIFDDPASSSGLRLGTEQEVDHPPVVEYAVRMKQLSHGHFIKQLLAAGAFTDEHLERVVRTLARFYREHPATPASSAWGAPERIRVSVDENFEQIADHAGSLLSKGALAALGEDAALFFERETALLERRVRSGMIRDCHGDLHLEHIHITPERVCIYDCIEFNERLRYIDVASDVAFLAMDLDHYGRPDLAARFIDQMREALEDPELVRLTPFYKTYRAIVRAKVNGMKSRGAEVPDSERVAAAELARAHFRLASQYAVTGDRPMVLAMVGRVATGKSTQARMLGESLGWQVISSDETRKRLAGVPLHERGDEATRAALYSEESSERTYGALLEQARIELQTGRGVVLDATFGRRRDRDRLRAMIGETFSPSGAPAGYRFVELVADGDLLRERLRHRESEASVVSDARLSDFDKLEARFETPEDEEDTALLRVSSAVDPEETHRRLLVGLVRSRYPSSGGE